MNPTKQEVMAELTAIIQKKWGAQAVRQGNEVAAASWTPLSTSLPKLDALLQGGILPGQITELCGVQTSGTATLALKTIAATQGLREKVIYIDPAFAFSPKYASDYGVDLQDLLIVRPTTPLEGMEIAADLMQRYVAGLLVFGHSASFMGDGSGVTLRRLLNVVRRSSCAFVVLNRASSPLNSPFHSHVATRLQLERIRWLRRWGVIGGYLVRVRVVKLNGSDCNRAVTLRFDLP